MMEIDKESKDLITALLEKRGFTNIKDTEEISHFHRMDLTAEKDGVRWAFEVKKRSFSSTKYGDICCESLKLSVLGDYDMVAVVNEFTDCIAIGDIKDGVRFKKWAPKTTSFSNNEMVLKEFLSIPQKMKFNKKTLEII